MWKDIGTKIGQLDWTEYYQCRDINMLNHILEENIRGALDTEAPLKFYHSRKKHVSWLSSDLKDLMTRRDDEKESAKKNG